MATLKTDYKDDVFEGNRKYNMVNNADGTVSLIDATEYTQEGDALSADDVNTISEAVNGAFQSASDGKQKIATAITGKGVPTSSGDTFQQMADNIGGIETDKTGDATAVAGDILLNKTAYAKRVKVTGNIPSKAAETITPGTTNKTIGAGQYLSGAQTIKGDANLIPSKIPEDLSLFGVQGTRKLLKSAKGTVTSSSDRKNFFYVNSTTDNGNEYYIQVTGLDFKPVFIVAKIYVPGNDTEYFVVYEECPGGYAPKEIKSAEINGRSTANGEHFRADMGDASIVYGSFLLPVRRSSSVFNWFAIGE